MDTLYVILDANFGERLRQIVPKPVWIVMSPINERVVRSIWRTSPPPDHTIGVTGFTFRADVAPEQTLLEELDTIDLHHGPYSTSSPYRELVVVGAILAPSVRSALSDIGFEHFIEHSDGFSTTRSEKKARELRQGA
jgi:hypothetical protein